MGNNGQLVLPGPDTAASSGYVITIDQATLVVTRSEANGTCPGCSSGSGTCNAGDEALSWVITVDGVQRIRVEGACRVLLVRLPYVDAVVAHGL